MICAPQPEPVEAGAQILEMGGNAIDAAIACSFVQSVVDPLMNGIAGFGSMGILSSDTGKVSYLDFHAKAPMSATDTLWADKIVGESRDGFGFIVQDHINELGYQSVAVPGTLKGLGQAHKQFGSLPWEELVKPAIEICQRGWFVRPHVEEFWSMGEDLGHAAHSDRIKFSKSGRKLYCYEDGSPKKVGELIINSDYKNTLELIAKEGPDSLYTGELAEIIAKDFRENGGLLTKEDLALYEVTRSEPLRGTYKGHEIVTNQPPGGGALLIQMLNLLEHFDVKELGVNTTEYIRIISEIQKFATVDKDKYLGDPNYIDIPINKFLDKSISLGRAEQIIKGMKVDVPRYQGGQPSKDTTHISVVDKYGNAVSLTHSLGMPSGVIIDGLGFMFNGCMAAFDPRPGRSTSIAPGKSRFSSMCPSFVFKDGKLKLVIGAPGATQITMGVLEVILNVLEFNMTMTEAVTMPRFSATSNIIDLAYRIPYRTVLELEKLGYKTHRDPRRHGFASVHGILVKENGDLDGGADPNHDGMWAFG